PPEWAATEGYRDFASTPKPTGAQVGRSRRDAMSRPRHRPLAGTGRGSFATAPVRVRSPLLRCRANAARNRADRVISSVVERFVHIEDVGGSNPSSPTIPTR